jgi:hypothetical protein
MTYKEIFISARNSANGRILRGKEPHQIQSRDVQNP